MVGDAADGRQAVEGVGRLEPDVVLMDIRCPSPTGHAPGQHVHSIQEERLSETAVALAHEGHTNAKKHAHAANLAPSHASSTPEVRGPFAPAGGVYRATPRTAAANSCGRSRCIACPAPAMRVIPACGTSRAT